MKNTNIKTIVAGANGNVDELKGLLAAARANGEKKVIVRIPRRLMAIDTRYQMENRTERDLKYLVNNWDERKLLPVTGIPHDELGFIFLGDGFGRATASGIVDANKYEYLECMVLLDAPTEEEERLIFEAELFATQNVNVSKLTPYQKHGALRCMGDEAVLALDEMKEKYGFEYVANRGVRDSGVLGSYSETYSICKRKGKDCLDYIFGIIAQSAFDRKANGYSTYMMRALRDAYVYFPNNREESSKFLSEYLRKFEPATFKAKAVSKYDMLEYKTAVSLYVEDLIADNLNLPYPRKRDVALLK